MSRPEETSAWIAYADFLMVLALLFFVGSVSLAFRSVRTAVVIGEVRADSAMVGGCRVVIGGTRETRSSSSTGFEFRFPGLPESVELQLEVDCPGYVTVIDKVRLQPADTVRKTVFVTKGGQGQNGDGGLDVEALPGDMLFAPNDYIVSDTAVDAVLRLGRRLAARLGPGKAIAVQGHTDDSKFRPGAGSDNWLLSSQRAWSVARLFVDSLRVSPCSIVIMGFGPSRPRERVDSIRDSWSERDRKRTLNRRIEFRLLTGADVATMTEDGC